jgi:ribosomal protein S21
VSQEEGILGNPKEYSLYTKPAAGHKRARGKLTMLSEKEKGAKRVISWRPVVVTHKHNALLLL